MHFAINIVVVLITLIDAAEDQSDSSIAIVYFNKDTKPRHIGREKNTKKLLLKCKFHQ